MQEILKGAILGLVEGLTEYLPISSSSHLEACGHLLDFAGPGTFEIAIQLGAILAMVVAYWPRFRGLLESGSPHRFAGLKAWVLLAITTFPVCLVGLLLHSWIRTTLASPFSLVCAMVTGAICMILAELRPVSPRCLDLGDLTPTIAFGVGLFQCLALWPGFSRSGATIMAGLLLGVKRAVAVEYSFIAAVPVMFAATGYDLLKNLASLTVPDIPLFATGLVMAFVSAICTIRFFIRLLCRVTLIPFAVYRLMAAPVIYLILA